MSSCFSPGISRVWFFKFLHSTFLRREKGINFDENLPDKKCSDESSLFLPSSVSFKSPHTCSVTRFDFLILGKLNSVLFKFCLIFAFCKQELIEKFEMDRYLYLKLTDTKIQYCTGKLLWSLLDNARGWWPLLHFLPSPGVRESRGSDSNLGFSFADRD